MGKTIKTRSTKTTLVLGFVDKPEDASKPIKKTKTPKETPAKTTKVKSETNKAPAKKTPTAAKVTKSESLKKAVGNTILDLCLVCDCTGSMYSWIQRAKDTLHSIIDSVKAENTGIKVRVAFVGYRDINDGKDRFSVIDFTEDLDSVKSFINS